MVISTGKERYIMSLLRKITSAFSGFFLALIGGCTNSTTAQIPAVEPFDIKAYAGLWYEIARMPNWFEKGMSDITAFYSLEPDGKIKVVNSGMKNGRRKEITGKAWFTVRPQVGALRVSFFYPFSGVYKIIHINDTYTLAVVAGGDYSLLWILARTPVISEAELERTVQWITAMGFESGKLIYTQKNMTLP